MPLSFYSNNSDKLLVKSFEKFLNYLIAVVVLLIAASFFIFKSPNENSANKAKLSNREVNKIVNKHLQQAVDQNRQVQIRTEIALRAARRKVEKEIQETRRKQDEANLNIPRERQIWTEAEMAERLKQQNQMNPGAVPENQGVASPQTKKTNKLNPLRAGSNSEEDFDIKSMTPEEKKEYAKQYIENARKGGYAIELDENMDVTKSTPIRKPTQQEDSYESLPTD